MSQYNKTVLTNAGLELAKRANAGQARFEITRTVTSADDWSNKTIQDIEAVTAIPNIMQQGTIRDTEEVESNNSVIGVSLCFANKDLSTGYQIKIIGVYVKEEGQDKDFLYAVTTAVTPEYMPDFSDGVLYRFNMQMYLVIGKAQAVNVVINDGASVTHGQFDKYKGEVAASVKSLTDSIATKADAKTVNDAISKIDFTPYAKTADVDSKLQGYTNTVALTKLLDVKANSVDVNNQINASEDKLNKAIAVKDDTSDVDAKIKTVTDLANTKASTTDVASQISASEDKLNKVIATKANTADVDAKIKTVTDLTNTKANSVDVYNKQAIDTAFSQRDSNITNAQNEVDQLKGRRQVDAQDFNNLTDTGTYYVSNPGANKPTGSWGNLLVSNGDGHRTSQLYFPDDNSAPWYRTLDEETWRDWTQLASASQVNDAQNAANSANTNANGKLPLGGGVMNLRSLITWNGGGTNDKTGNLGGITWNGGTDWAKIYGDQDDNDNLDLAFDLGDDGSNHVSFRKNGSETSAITSDGHFTGTVDWGHVNGRPQDQVDRVNIITPLFRQIQNSNNWNDIFGVGNPNNVLTSLRIDAGGSGALLNNFAAGIGFGGGDTKGVLSVAYGDHQARITGGNGNGPVWSEDIAWKSDVNDLRNQVQQLRENQFETQTFTDATAAANWEAQRPGHRLAIIQS